MVNEPSVFEPSKFYCSFHTYRQDLFHDIHVLSIKSVNIPALLNMVDGPNAADVVSYREAISREAVAANGLNVTVCSGNVGCKDRSDSVSEVV